MVEVLHITCQEWDEVLVDKDTTSVMFYVLSFIPCSSRNPLMIRSAWSL